MAYNWSADLETGHAKIDEQHKQLFTAINNLLEACSKGKGRDALKETTSFLYDYTARHFADEEKLQLASQYPDYKNHKQYHETFKKTVRELMDELEAKGPNVVLVGKVNTAVGGWLINHIKREDVKVAAHLRAKK